MLRVTYVDNLLQYIIRVHPDNFHSDVKTGASALPHVRISAPVERNACSLAVDHDLESARNDSVVTACPIQQSKISLLSKGRKIGRIQSLVDKAAEINSSYEARSDKENWYVPHLSRRQVSVHPRGGGGELFHPHPFSKGWPRAGGRVHGERTRVDLCIWRLQRWGRERGIGCDKQSKRHEVDEGEAGDVPLPGEEMVGS